MPVCTECGTPNPDYVEDEPPCDCGCFWCEEGEHCGSASYEGDTGAWIGCLHDAAPEGRVDGE